MENDPLTESSSSKTYRKIYKIEEFDLYSSCFSKTFLSKTTTQYII